MTSILAIDPGPTESAYVLYIAGRVQEHDKVHNDVMLQRLGMMSHGETQLVIEQIASYGMSVGAEVFETCVWTGRFMERWLVAGGRVDRMKRHAVKMFHCHKTTAKDGNIRQAIIDRYGGKDAAIGKKNTPGPLYGIVADEWAALALAIAYAESSKVAA